MNVTDCMKKGKKLYPWCNRIGYAGNFLPMVARQRCVEDSKLC